MENLYEMKHIKQSVSSRTFTKDPRILAARIIKKTSEHTQDLYIVIDIVTHAYVLQYGRLKA